MSATIDIHLDKLLDPNKTLNIAEKMAVYWKSLEKFQLLYE